MLLLLVATAIVCQSIGQPLEYLCSPSSRNTSSFQVTLLLNIHYGPECNQLNPRWPDGTELPQELLSWQEKLQTKIRFNIIDTCSDSDIAAKAIGELIPYSWTSAATSISFCTVNGSSPINVGFITETLPTGYDTESRLLGQVNVPLILTSDDIINSQSSEQPSVITVSDGLQAKLEAMSKLMVEMQWDFVTVIYSDDAIGRLNLELFQNISMKYYICIDNSTAVAYTSRLADFNTTGVVLLGSEGIGLHLLGQLTLSPRVWVTGHDISGLAIKDGVKVYSVVGESGSQLVINSLVSFSKALEEAENKPDCSPSGDPDQCISSSEFRQSLIENLTVNLHHSHSINSNGVVQPLESSTNSTYKVYFHKENTTLMAEILANGSTSADEGFNLEPSLCTGAKCKEKCGHFNEDQYTYIHGKWVIVLFLPIHDITNLSDPFACKDFSKRRLFRSEAAVYTLEYLKRTLDDDRFGLLVIDSCKQKLHVTALLYNIELGYKKICNVLGECFEPNSTVLILGDHTSTLTQQLLTITMELPEIHMAYGASSITLNNREEYPYFLRTNPADDLQAHFMVELLNFLVTEYGAKIDAVNLIYTDSLYGRTAAKEVNRLLKNSGIGLGIEEKISTGRTDFNALVRKLTHYTGNVKIIIAFLGTEHIEALFNEANDTAASRQAWKIAGLIFIFSESWNNNTDYLRNYGDLVLGSFSFKFDSSFSSTSFKSYLKDIGVPSLSDRNYWLSTLVQEAGKCKIRGNFHSTYNDSCNSTSAELTQLDGELYASLIMKAITASVYGIRKIVSDKSDDVVFRANTIQNRYNQLLQIDIPPTLEDSGEDFRYPFNNEGNGNVGYLLFHIKLDENYGRPTYHIVQRTGSSLQYKLQSFPIVPLTYKYDDHNWIPVTVIESCKVQGCRHTTTQVGTTKFATSPHPNGGSKDSVSLMISALTSVSTLFGILLVTSSIILVYRYRQKSKIRKAAADEHAPADGGKEPTYNEISYEHYMTGSQREAISNFVRGNPESQPSSSMLSPRIYNNIADMNCNTIPMHSVESEPRGTCNAAYSGSGDVCVHMDSLGLNMQTHQNSGIAANDGHPSSTS